MVVSGRFTAHVPLFVARQLQLTGDPQLEVLLDEIRDYPGPLAPDAPDASAIMVQLCLADADGDADGELTFFSTITTFGTAADITVSELSVEAFFPADAETAERLRRRSEPHL